MTVERKHHRLGMRYGRLVGFVAAIMVGAAAVGAFLVGKADAPESRVNVVVMGNPVTIVSWEGRRRALTLLELPAGAHIPGVYGVGSYSLEALWRLGAIDQRDTAILPLSLEEMLGVPLPWYAGPTSEISLPRESGRDEVGKIFSLGNITSFLTGRVRTNIPLPMWLSLTVSLRSARPQSTMTLRAEESGVLRDTALSDGSTVTIIDSDRLQVMVGTAFEDERIRKEALRVAIFNTTSTPTLGARAERLLTHVGALVAFVGNDEGAFSRCQVSGNTKALSSYTAKFIVHHYRCEPVPGGEDDQADIVVRLGRDYEARFLPRAYR